MNGALLNKIRQCPSLPTLPAVALRVLEIAAVEQADMSEMAQVIIRDPALTAKILKTVNSSFYALNHGISTIKHALVILGSESVKALVLGFSLMSNLSQSPKTGFNHLDYWRRSIYAATAARVIAGKLHLMHRDECFIAALLQDIGMLILDQVLGETYGSICRQATSHKHLCQRELELIGGTHAEVSGYMAEQWRLPQLLRIPIAWHHRCDEAPVSDVSLQRLVEVVSLSGRCADVFVEQDSAEAIADVRRFCLAKYEMPENDCDAMLESVYVQTREVAALLEVSLAPGAHYESMLRKANETLVELTLRAQRQAADLQRQNTQLETESPPMTNALPELPNGVTLDALVSTQFTKSLQSGQSLSVLVLEVDEFKSINDTHGQQAGDDALRMLSRLLRGAARSQDLAARFGDETMILVMPGADCGIATATAEAVRRTIAATPLSMKSGSINVTISVGVATCDEDLQFKHYSQLIKAADMAMYAAKRCGRNCVKVFAAKTKAPAIAAA